MASSGNFCTWNPLDCASNLVFNTGNLSTDQDNNDWRGMFGTHSFTSGKWYWEAYQNANNANNGFPVAIQRASDGKNYLMWSGSDAYLGRAVSTYGYSYAIYTNAPTYSEKRHNGSNANTNLSAGASGDIYQLAVDLDAGKIWFGKNNTWADSGDPANGTNEAYSSIPAGTYVPASVTWNSSGSDNFVSNFGQDDTFGGAISAAGNADGNGFGVFKYSPPTGFLALCSANLPISEDIDPAETDDDYPGKQFFMSQYSGNGTNRTITTEAQPDLIFIRSYNGSQDWYILDSSRGITANKYLLTNETNAEATLPQSNFTSVGATSVGISSGTWLNSSGSEYQMWMWKCNGGTTASNAEGSTTCTVQANTKGGLSIITYSGTGSAATLGHGLEKAPEFMMAKRRSSAAQSWKVYHKGVGATKYLTLNTGDAEATSSGMWNDTAPSTTLISIGNESNVSTSGLDYIIYAWHSVDGFSKFGTYVGNADANGPFVYTGFRPSMLFLKNATASNGWFIYDKLRDGFNPQNNTLSWQDSTTSDNTYKLDILSNGFKIKGSNNAHNQSGQTFIYGAWADVPFKYNNTF